MPTIDLTLWLRGTINQIYALQQYEQKQRLIPYRAEGSASKRHCSPASQQRKLWMTRQKRARRSDEMYTRTTHHAKLIELVISDFNLSAMLEAMSAILPLSLTKSLLHNLSLCKIAPGYDVRNSGAQSPAMMPPMAYIACLCTAATEWAWPSASPVVESCFRSSDSLFRDEYCHDYMYLRRFNLSFEKLSVVF